MVKVDKKNKIFCKFLVTPLFSNEYNNYYTYCHKYAKNNGWKKCVEKNN